MALLSIDQLTDEQKEALQYMKDFIEGPNREMILCGPAGTGKTSLVNVLLSELDKSKKRGKHKFYDYICTATTNKAVEVIARNTGRDYDRTIYSLEGLTVKDEDDRGAYIVREPGSQSKLKDYDLVIVDEASMVPMMLMQELELDLMEHSRTKIIFIGDNCQLPPVADKQMGRTQSMVFELPIGYMLTKVMRTALDNPILRLVTRMRDDMMSPVDLFEHKDDVLENGDGVRFYDKRNEFMATAYDYFKSEEYKKDTDYCMVVAWRNISVDAVNVCVRKRIYPDTDAEYVEGEEVSVKVGYRRPVPDKPDKLYPVYTREERLIIMGVEDTKDPKYEMDCWKVTVCNFRASSKNQNSTVAYILKKAAVSEYNKLCTAVADECRAREKIPGHDGTGHMYTKKEAWKPFGELKRYYLWVDYIYAMTTHRAQGTTVQNVFVVQRDMDLNLDIEERNKLKYTAFTRAAKQLHILV